MTITQTFIELFGLNFDKTLAQEITWIVASMFEDFSVKEVLKVLGFQSVENQSDVSEENVINPKIIVDTSLNVGICKKKFEKNKPDEKHCGTENVESRGKGLVNPISSNNLNEGKDDVKYGLKSLAEKIHQFYFRVN